MIIKSFESFSIKLKPSIEEIFDKYQIDISVEDEDEDFRMNEDGSFDVDGDVSLYDLNISTMPLIFRNVIGEFSVINNKFKNFNDFPNFAGKSLFLTQNKFTSLEGCPRSPHIFCGYNPIVDFGKNPLNFETLYCHGCPIEEIYNLDKRSEFINLIIEYDVIRDGNKIVRKRLERALEDSGIESGLYDMPKSFEFKYYELI